jgi:hypothetical protein
VAGGTTSYNVPYVGVVAGRLAIITVSAKPSTATFTAPAGWAAVSGSAANGGTGTNAADTGPTAVAKFYRILDGTETGSVTITSTGGTGAALSGVMDVFSGTVGSWALPFSASASDTTNGTNYTAVTGTWTQALAVGDMMHVGIALNTDFTTAITSPTLSATSETFGTVTAWSRLGNSSGNQTTTYTFGAVVSAGATTNALTVGFTCTGSSSGVMSATVLREVATKLSSSVSDDFNDNSLDTTKWSSYGLASEASQQMQFTTSTTYTGLTSKTYTKFDSVYARLIPGASNGASTECYLQMMVYDQSKPAGTQLGIYIDILNGVFYCSNQTAYFDASATSITYNSVTHAWFQIIISGTNVLFQSSPDGATWTTQRTLAKPTWLNSSPNIVTNFETHRDAGTNNISAVDNYNTAVTTVAKSSDLRWGVNSTVSTSSDLRWAVLQQVPVSSDLRWSVSQQVSANSDLRWAVYSSVSKSCDLRWSVSQQVSVNSDLRWSSAGSVSVSSDLRWTVASTISVNSDLRWLSYNAVSKSSDLRWSVSQQVAVNSDLRWISYSQVAVNSDLRWTSAGSVSVNSDLRWTVASAVSKNSDLRWAVQSTVTVNSDLRWLSYNQVTVNSDLRWTSAGSVSVNSDLRWGVNSSVSINSDLRWSVTGQVQVTSDIRWQSFSTTTKTSTFQWAVLSSEAPADSLAIAAFNIPPRVDQLEPVLPSLGYPIDRVVKELTGGLVRIYRRVEIYEADGLTKFDIPNWDARLITGSVTVDRERDEKRICEFTLDNTDRRLNDEPNDGFWFDKILKCMWGIRYYDETAGMWKRWETQLGEFMIDRIDSDRFPNEVKVTGRDYAKKCIVSKLSNTLSFPIGTKVEDIIIALAANAGVTKFAMPATGQAYTKDLVFTRGTERWEVMQQIADSIGYEVFFRGDGRLTMQPYPDPSTDPLAWSFSTDGGGSLVSYSKSSNDSLIFNHIIVTGSTIGGEPDELGGAVTGNSVSQIVFAEALNTLEGSPTRISRMGDRVQTYESDLFTTVDQAQDYADTQLRISSLEEYSVNFESLVLPFLDASQIVEIRQPTDDLYTPNRFLLSSFTIPMDLGPMSGTARRVTVVGTKSATEFS